MKINLPLLSQRDDRWKTKKLGTSLLTLGTSGCLVTCLAMVSKHYGKETDPSKLNEAILAVNGFAPDNPAFPGKNLDLYIWNSINKIYSDISETKNTDTPLPVSTKQFELMEVELAAGRPVILKVDFTPATASVDMHFVVLVGKENGEWIVADPWYGDFASLKRYGDPAKTIQKFVFTFGPIPTQPVTEPSSDQQNALAVLTEGFKALPSDDKFKEGNMEGYARGIVPEHLLFAEASERAKGFDAFIEKWFQEWGLKKDPKKSHQVLVEEEMGKLLSYEDRTTSYRNGIEEVVGSFDNDSALLKALGAVKDDKNVLVDKVDKLTKQLEDLKKKQNILYTFNLFKFTVRVSKVGDK